jgi:hypothetical protein
MTRRHQHHSIWIQGCKDFLGIWTRGGQHSTMTRFQEGGDGRGCRRCQLQPKLEASFCSVDTRTPPVVSPQCAPSALAMFPEPRRSPIASSVVDAEEISGLHFPPAANLCSGSVIRHPRHRHMEPPPGQSSPAEGTLPLPRSKQLFQDPCAVDRSTPFSVTAIPAKAPKRCRVAGRSRRGS